MKCIRSNGNTCSLKCNKLLPIERKSGGLKEWIRFRILNDFVLQHSDIVLEGDEGKKEERGCCEGGDKEAIWSVD